MIELGRHAPEALVALGGGAPRRADELAGLAHAIGHAIAPLEPGARVVLACEDRYYFAACLLALWERAAVAVLPANGQPETVRALSRAAWARGLLHDRDDDEGLDVRTLEGAAPRAPAFPVALAMHEPAVLAFTSGSTGTPAAHEKTLAQLVEEPRALIAAFDLAHRRVVASVPPYHLYGLLFGVLVPLLGAGTMTRNAPLQPSEVLRELAEVDGEVLVAVPPQLSALAAHLESRASEVPKLLRLFSSGAPLPSATDDALHALGLTVTQVLGSTETGGIAHRERAGDTLWRPLPHVSVRSDDGLLCVASPWSSATPGLELRTQDRVAFEGPGFRHLGRADQVVKVAGRRIDLGDLEAHLKRVPGVRDARVIAVETRSLRGVELWAVVESPLGVNVPSLRRSLVARFDPVTVPRRYRVVSALPRGAAGKIERKSLMALFDVWEPERTTLEDGSVAMRAVPEYGYFQGHFDGDPILPGVVQLEQLALRTARLRFPELRHVARLTRIKFKRPIRPNEELVVKVEKKGELSVSFELRADGDVAASGILHFRGAP